jgi:hypothetical protein
MLKYQRGTGEDCVLATSLHYGCKSLRCQVAEALAG